MDHNNVHVGTRACAYLHGTHNDENPPVNCFLASPLSPGRSFFPYDLGGGLAAPSSDSVCAATCARVCVCRIYLFRFYVITYSNKRVAQPLVHRTYKGMYLPMLIYNVRRRPRRRRHTRVFNGTYSMFM